MSVATATHARPPLTLRTYHPLEGAPSYSMDLRCNDPATMGELMARDIVVNFVGAQCHGCDSTANVPVLSGGPRHWACGTCGRQLDIPLLRRIMRHAMEESVHFHPRQGPGRVFIMDALLQAHRSTYGWGHQWSVAPNPRGPTDWVRLMSLTTAPEG